MTLRVLVAVRNAVFVAVYDAILLLTPMPTQAEAQYGAAEEAKALLDKAVAAVKEDKAKALDMFNKGGTVTFMCSAPTPLTASSPRIRRIRANS